MKAGYVLLDGCADRPDPRLNYTTPLEAAYTPNLDSLASNSDLGRVITVRRGVAPESDIAVFNMLGYSFSTGYPGRGVVEAIGSGLRLRDGDLALRANFATCKGARITDRRAGRNLTQPEADALAEDVASIRLEGAEFRFRATVSYRGVLVIRADTPLSAEVANTDPAYARVGGFGAAKETSKDDAIQRCAPLDKSPEARRAAQLVNQFSDAAKKVLDASPVNRQRVREGKLPANCVLLRDAGDHLPKVQSFREKYGMRGTALVEMPAEVGIAKILGMKMVSVPDRHDMVKKASLFSRELREGSVVYVHIKGPDEFGHDGDALGKKLNIESIDRGFFAGVASGSSDATVGVSCDHATPSALKMHSSDPVPLMVTTRSAGQGLRFTERNSSKGSLGLLKGSEVLAKVLRSRQA